ncbi:MAG TPA: hypothetical protein VGB82_09180 [Alphaproteobacteria bacterium]
MGTALSPLDDKFHDWQRRAARYRQLSTLLGEDETAGRLRILALEMEQRLRTFRRAAAAAQARMLDNAILLAEIDTFLARARGASQRLRPLGLSADDLWEESRLCREEAQESEDAATRQAFASRALALAAIGEKIGREHSADAVTRLVAASPPVSEAPLPERR